VLYSYVRPRKLPEHDDIKTASISLDTENLLRRIVALVPDSVQVERRKTIALDFLAGKTKRMAGLRKLARLPEEARDLFYLLADFTFKSNSEMDRAIELYAVDLSFTRKRFDTWAALALAQRSKMDHKLNSCKEIGPQAMLAEIESSEMCFRQCLDINSLNSNLWIEFGNFSYSIHSYLSRTLQNGSENLNFDMFNKLEGRKEEFLKMALNNYQKTLDIFAKEGINPNDVDERWLLLFMMGKIKEKQGVELSTCLESYLQSIVYIKNNDVVLPRRINYNTPPDFTIEALEVYYRIHASELKAVARAEEGKEVAEVEARAYYQAMPTAQLDVMFTTNAPWRSERWESRKRKAEGQAAAEEPLAKVGREEQETTGTAIMRDVVEVVDTMIDNVEWMNDATKFSMSSLAKLALLGLEDVVFTFPHHFKALYRMAHYFHNSPVARNMNRVTG
jgi:calcineurin-binding protein cabin-1